jgi:heme-degrading monooxygenase HmoA
MGPRRYAVIFSSERGADDTGYAEMDAALLEEVRQQPGFAGVDSLSADGRSITVSYWESREAIRAWREHALHREAQARGRSLWYRRYRIQVCRIERDYAFDALSAPR